MNVILNGIVKKSLIPSLSITRSISVTSACRLKQINVERDDQKQVVTISGKFEESPNKPFLIPQVTECKNKGEQFCPECTLGLDVRHTDVLILSQFVRPDGCMLPRRVTGLCKLQQKRFAAMVTMAQKAGLMMNLTPKYCKKDPKKRFQDKKFNKYYFEETIQCSWLARYKK